MNNMEQNYSVFGYSGIAKEHASLRTRLGVHFAVGVRIANNVNG